MTAGNDTEPFDIADYTARVHDRTDDYELRLDAARVGAEIRRLRGIIQRVAEAPNPWAVQAILYAEGFADSPELSE